MEQVFSRTKVKVGKEFFYVEIAGLNDEKTLQFRIKDENEKFLLRRNIPFREQIDNSFVFAEKERGFFVVILGSPMVFNQIHFDNVIVGIYSIPHGFRILVDNDNVRKIEKPYPPLFSLFSELKNNKHFFDVNTFILDEIRKGYYDLIPYPLDLVKEIGVNLAVVNRDIELDKLKLFASNTLIPLTMQGFGHNVGQLLDSVASLIQTKLEFPEPDIMQKEIEEFKERLSARIEMETGAIVIANYITQYGVLFAGLMFVSHEDNLMALGYLFSADSIKADMDFAVQEAVNAVKRSIENKEEEVRFSMFLAIPVSKERREEFQEFFEKGVSQIIDAYSEDVDNLIDSLELVKGAVKSLDILKQV